MTPTPVLSKELTIYTIGELRPAWLQWLDAGAPDGATASRNEDAFCVDGAGVEEVDAAGIQLLLSLDRALSQQQGRHVRLLRASAPLVRACTALGVQQLLDATSPAESLA